MRLLPFVMPVTMALLTLSVSSSLPTVHAASRDAVLLVTNKGDDTLSILDPQSGRQIGRVAEGGVTGHEVAASSDGKLAYVPIYGDSGVGKPGTDGRHLAVIDIATGKVIGDVDFGHGVRPHCAVFAPQAGPNAGLLYVTTELDDTITMIDPHTLKIVGSIPTGQPESHMLALTPDGRRGYTANVGPGTVSVLDMGARKTIAVIPVAAHIQRISVSADGKWVFTSDQTKPQVAVIDTVSNKIKSWIALPSLSFATTPTPDGKWLLVAMSSVNKVAIVSLATMKVVTLVEVPAADAV